MKVNLRFFGWFLAIFLILSVGFNISQYFQNRKLKNEQQTELDRIKAEKDSVIHANELAIDSLLINLNAKDQIIEFSEGKIDSLQKARDSIKVIYKTKLVEVENFNSNELEDYWRNELNK